MKEVEFIPGPASSGPSSSPSASDISREPVTSVAELVTLDTDEMIEGYRDGFAGDEEPGGNRSKSYWHGWRNGHADRTGKSDAAALALAHEIVRTARQARAA